MQHNGWVYDSGRNDYIHRLLIGTPTTGTVRMEWHIARMGQIVPTNWSQATAAVFHAGNSVVTFRYPVADAQNLIVKTAINQHYDWLFLHEHDVILPPDTFIRLNQYMRDQDVPVVSGLYWTRSRPSEPILYRGRGNSFYTDWQIGDVVWVDGLPTGALLIHGSILQAMWDEAEEYTVYGERTRRVFQTPTGQSFDPTQKAWATYSGTSDLYWCKDVMQHDILRKAGWSDYADRDFPFAVDTNIFCAHINPNGEQFPYANPWLHVPERKPEQPPAVADLGVSVADGLAASEALGG